MTSPSKQTSPWKKDQNEPSHSVVEADALNKAMIDAIEPFVRRGTTLKEIAIASTATMAYYTFIQSLGDRQGTAERLEVLGELTKGALDDLAKDLRDNSF